MNRQEHLMTIAMEECNEVAQRISKAMRFGMEQVQQDADDKPEQNPKRLTNRQRIIEEYEHLAAAMEMIGILSLSRAGIDAKHRQVERYLLRSRENGTLTE